MEEIDEEMIPKLMTYINVQIQQVLKTPKWINTKATNKNQRKNQKNKKKPKN